MAGEKQKSSSPREKDKNEKKQRKREKRLEEQLISARAALSSAGERFERTKEQVNKRKARVERLEEQLTRLLHIQEEAPEAISPFEESSLPPADLVSSQASEQVVIETVLPEEEAILPAEAALEAVERKPLAAAASSQDIQHDYVSERTDHQDVPIVDRTGEAIARAKVARETAQAAEETARQAIEGVYALIEQLEEVGYSRHLTDELAHLQEEADSAKQQALKAEQQAVQVEQEVGLSSTSSDEYVAQTQTPSTVMPTENDEPKEIEEDEMTVEAVSALIIADAAAVAAAEAEALAETSSLRAREARLSAQEADEALAQIRRALESGGLSGDKAGAALLAAEQRVTHAHTVLAEAEAAEERARLNAVNAEAEAEVAEGMAFATDISEA